MYVTSASKVYMVVMWQGDIKRRKSIKDTLHGSMCTDDTAVTSEITVPGTTESSIGVRPQIQLF